MPESLITPWKCVATSGPTIDGRFIKEQWLKEMAETYDPDTYRAKLWVEHMRYSSYGSVVELKAETVGDKVKLFAKIAPSRSLLQLNMVWEEKLTFSIEPIENFAKTGKTYLGGLGMTDEPASLGTDQMIFAKLRKNDRDFTARYAGEPVPDLRITEDDQQVEKSMGKFLSRFFNQQISEESDMSQKQLDALTQQVKTLSTQFKEFKKPEVQTPPAESEETSVSTEQFSTLLTTVKTLADTQKELGSQFTTLAGKLEKVPAPGTQFGEHTGGDDKVFL